MPLSALLSQTLVAFTIEFDNEFEHLTPHRTTNHGSTGVGRSAPWLVSMAMWLRLMRYVPEQGIAPKDLWRKTGLKAKEFRTLLTRMSKWWGYVAVTGSLVRPTPGGLKALRSWQPLTATIEERWRQRYGATLFEQLCQTLQAFAQELGPDYPDSLPILGYDLLSPAPDPADGVTGAASTLAGLLAKVLLAFAVEFESESGQSLAISANALRLAGDEGVRVRDLPPLSGVSKEAVALCVSRLEKRGQAVVQPESPGSRVKRLVLTPSSQEACAAYHSITRDIEKRWQARLGSDHTNKLRRLLESFAGERLFEAVQPYPDGWRAALPKRENLPHYPMLLHRGGFPDGS